MYGTFISKAFDVSIVGGNAVLRYECGDQTIIPMPVFREMVRRGHEALAEIDNEPTNVVPPERLASMRSKFIIVHGEAM